MISKETCVKVWTCYNEIEKAEKLLQETKLANQNRGQPNLEDNSGNRTGHTFGLAKDFCTHELYHVEPALGVKIIKAHIRSQREKLKDLEIVVAMEMAPEVKITVNSKKR